VEGAGGYLIRVRPEGNKPAGNEVAARILPADFKSTFRPRSKFLSTRRSRLTRFIPPCTFSLRLPSLKQASNYVRNNILFYRVRPSSPQLPKAGDPEIARNRAPRPSRAFSLDRWIDPNGRNSRDLQLRRLLRSPCDAARAGKSLPIIARFISAELRSPSLSPLPLSQPSLPFPPRDLYLSFPITRVFRWTSIKNPR